MYHIDNSTWQVLEGIGFDTKRHSPNPILLGFGLGEGQSNYSFGVR